MTPVTRRAKNPDNFADSLADTYLNDPDHEWKIDPAARLTGEEDVIRDLLMDVVGDQIDGIDGIDVLNLVLAGARGLLERGAGTPSECLRTSMIWYYG